MVRASSSTDARVRWYREHQKQRNWTRGLYRGASVIRAYYRMPLRLRGERQPSLAPLVDTRGIGARLDTNMDAQRVCITAMDHWLVNLLVRWNNERRRKS